MRVYRPAVDCLNLSKAGWSWGCVSPIFNGRTTAVITGNSNPTSNNYSQQLLLRSMFGLRAKWQGHDGTGALIASNNNWATTIIGGIITANQIRDIRNSGHAPGDPFESATIADLPAGSYTAIVRGVNNTTGVALVEVYDLDQ
jgi:hypothetical protein